MLINFFFGQILLQSMLLRRTKGIQFMWYRQEIYSLPMITVWLIQFLRHHLLIASILMVNYTCVNVTFKFLCRSWEFSAHRILVIKRLAFLTWKTGWIYNLYFILRVLKSVCWIIPYFEVKYSDDTISVLHLIHLTSTVYW